MKLSVADVLMLLRKENAHPLDPSRLPKLKGFSNAGFGTTYQVVNTGRLAELFPEGGDVTPENLVAKGAARKGELIKVLGTGELSVALRVTAHAFSASATAKIEQAGGTVTELS